MLRLFVSLYLVVISGIFTINWASELLWQKLNQDEKSELATTIALVKDLATLITSQQQLALLTSAQLQPEQFSYQLLEFNDIAWLPEQQQQLASGQVLPLYNLQQQLYLYAKTSDGKHLLQLGPINQQHSSSITKTLLQIASYLLLALILILWTRPVWQDLTRLTQLANNIDSLKDIPEPPIQSRSPIANVVQTMGQMAAKIKHLINEQKQLVNAVSHELRTPLSRLRFSLAMLTNINDQQRDEIEQDLQEIETLVDEMLSYSRIEHLAVQQNKTLANVSELLSHQLEKHGRLHSKKIIADIPTELVITCNGELVERACQNLITNALRYAKQQVRISAAIKQQLLTISIEDDGAGIAEEDWPTLFEPFSRVEQSRNKNQGGYGLGLAIVKKACDWHLGQCHVNHSPLGGACFTITLPVE
ncbi:two-component sensor histidine kinase [Thalassotalea insulae]|uniref:histidine kinase n=1 Tax=Thalassotalea insulae TaxID=2056778 RepID=A0ABQ6GSQ9_9GAMM|nr:ATP-binding protein [Thalassotalea insulae]GLX77485.1 two-component sensor histidine kinase [Thalassotalea insulae]